MRFNMMQRLNQAMNDIRMLQQNPGQIGQYLSSHGMISKEQVECINKMGSPSQIGQYLMQNGVMPQQSVQQMYQTVVPTIQNNLK